MQVLSFINAAKEMNTFFFSHRTEPIELTYFNHHLP